MAKQWVTGKKGFWEQCIYEKDSGFLIAKAINRKRDEEVINEDDADTLANARLIATAPELLQQCKNTLRQIEQIYNSANIVNKPIVEGLCLSIRGLKGVIAKAEGGE